MKSFFRIPVTFVCVLLLGFATQGQTIRIADNNTIRPTGTNIYSTLQAAINAAQPDDIVYITPSNTSYGDITISKRIILQGVGNIAELGDRYSVVGIISLVSSADGVNSISGTILREFHFERIQFQNTGIGTPIFDNIIIEKVYSMGSNYSISAGVYVSVNRAINNLIIRNSSLKAFYFAGTAGLTNCKIYNNTFSTFSISGASGILNNTISNNIILSTSNVVYTSGVVNNTLVVNNIFSGAGDAFDALDGIACINNIFYGITLTTSSTGTYFRNNNFSNNLVTATTPMPPAGNGGGTNSGVGNLVGVSPNFVSVAGTTWSASNNYSLNTGSLAKNAGSDGTDIGPTGGAYPINKNIVFGPAALPLITELNTSGVVPQNQPLKANLKAKSN